jgi:RNA recognition motif-containing protein
MATEDARKLFVAGLPESITEDVLRELFEATGGTVVNVSLPRDRATGRPRGFGFVTLSSAEEAHSARQSLDGSLQAGRAISVRPFQSEPPKRGETRSETIGPPSAAASEDRTLYVGNLPYDTTQNEVESLFADNGAGPIVRIHLPTGPDGRLRGFGFVTLGSAESANAAITALREVDVRGRRLMINIAHPRERGGPGAGGGAGGDRMPSRRPMHSEGPHEPRSFERFSEPMPPMGGGGGVGGGPGGFGDSARPVEGRRARPGAERPDRGGGGGGGGGVGDFEADKKKQKKKKRGAAVETKKDKERGGGGGGSVRNWEDWDED